MVGLGTSCQERQLPRAVMSGLTHMRHPLCTASTAQALERFIPDIRDRAELTMVGSPLTHARFTRRHKWVRGGGCSSLCMPPLEAEMGACGFNMQVPVFRTLA